jgi:hypothetical protein
MKKIVLKTGIIIGIFIPSMNRAGIGESFGGAFLGSTLSNVITQPRQSYQAPCCQAPVHTRVVEVQRPTYVVEQPRRSRFKQEKKRRIPESDREQTIHATTRSQSEKQIADEVQRQMALKDKEFEIKRLDAEKAKIQAENEQLKLQIKKLELEQKK